MRAFSAVIIGEPQRAFYSNKFGLTFPVFEHFGVQLWLPKVGGPIDPGSDGHDLVLSLYGGMSKGERNRTKIRVRSAMAAQAAIEGRFLGGRPPYGYRLADAGPHPNPANAADGRRLHVLVPDPITAPIVARILTFPPQAALAECDRKLANYRAALDTGADPAVVAEWIAQAQAEKRAAKPAPERSHPPPAAD